MKDITFSAMARARLVHGIDPVKIAQTWGKQFRAMQDALKKDPARKAALAMTPDEFDALLAAIQVVIVSNTAVILLNGKPEAAFAKTKDGLDIEPVDMPRDPAISGYGEVPAAAGTVSNLTPVPGDTAKVIEALRGESVVGKIVAKLPEKAWRKNVKAGWVMKIARSVGASCRGMGR